MTKLLVRCLLISSALITFTGCKLAVMVPSGGDVTSASNTRNCSGGSLCEHNITDSTFNESFTAVARPGYVFSKWNTGAGFLCGDSTNPTCTISNVGTAGNAFIGAVIATGQFFYAMPLFEFVGIDTDGDGIKDHLDEDDDNDGVFDVDDSCPLLGPNRDGFGCPNTYTVLANGKEWYQPDLFTNLSWNQISTVCPYQNGACIAGGQLNGHDMTGWTWASVEDVSNLLNSYGVSPPLAGNDCRRSPGQTWIQDFYEAGWRPTGYDNPQYLIFQFEATLREEASALVARSVAVMDLSQDQEPEDVTCIATLPKGYADPSVGAVFYRDVN